MQAFKAANPQCVLEDFGRWYRDDEEEEGGGKDGGLKHAPWVTLTRGSEGGGEVGSEGGSEGGGGEGGGDDGGGAEGSDGDDGGGQGSDGRASRSPEEAELWSVLWGATQPVPASQQRPLFDADREANEALDQLDATSPAELLRHLLRETAEGAIAALATSPLFQLSPRARGMADGLLQSVRALHAARSLPSEWRVPLLDGMAALEHELERAAALQMKLPDHPQLVRALLSDPALQSEATVPSGARAALTRRLYDSESDDLLDDDPEPPEPDLSEYVLRAVAPMPSEAPCALPTAHRMYVALRGDQWRVAIALSEDHNA